MFECHHDHVMGGCEPKETELVLEYVMLSGHLQGCEEGWKEEDNHPLLRFWDQHSAKLFNFVFRYHEFSYVLDNHHHLIRVFISFY